ncbi:hypothetical protein AAF712_016023, partial [Marasmius tenuissimus]
MATHPDMSCAEADFQRRNNLACFGYQHNSNDSDSDSDDTDSSISDDDDECGPYRDSVPIPSSASTSTTPPTTPGDISLADLPEDVDKDDSHAYDRSEDTDSDGLKHNASSSAEDAVHDAEALETVLVAALVDDAQLAPSSAGTDGAEDDSAPCEDFLLDELTKADDESGNEEDWEEVVSATGAGDNRAVAQTQRENEENINVESDGFGIDFELLFGSEDTVQEPEEKETLEAAPSSSTTESDANTKAGTVPEEPRATSSVKSIESSTALPPVPHNDVDQVGTQSRAIVAPSTPSEPQSSHSSSKATMPKPTGKRRRTSEGQGREEHSGDGSGSKSSSMTKRQRTANDNKGKGLRGKRNAKASIPESPRLLANAPVKTLELPPANKIRMIIWKLISDLEQRKKPLPRDRSVYERELTALLNQDLVVLSGQSVGQRVAYNFEPLWNGSSGIDPFTGCNTKPATTPKTPAPTSAPVPRAGKTPLNLPSSSSTPAAIVGSIVLPALPPFVQKKELKSLGYIDLTRDSPSPPPPCPTQTNGKAKEILTYPPTTKTQGVAGSNLLIAPDASPAVMTPPPTTHASQSSPSIPSISRPTSMTFANASRVAQAALPISIHDHSRPVGKNLAAWAPSQACPPQVQPYSAGISMGAHTDNTLRVSTFNRLPVRQPDLQVPHDISHRQLQFPEQTLPVHQAHTGYQQPWLATGTSAPMPQALFHPPQVPQ